MPAQTFYRASSTKNQPVYQPARGAGGAFAPGLGAGRPGRARSSQIRKIKAIKGRVHGTSVLRSGNSRGPGPGTSRNDAHVPSGAVARAPRGYQAGTVGGNQRGPSAGGLGAYRQSNKKNTGAKRGILRGYVAG